ncbi:hypothetical protein ACOM2C_01295 [Pseudarthrobacter sp. So.54]
MKAVMESRTSSSTRSALIAIAAADPSPAAVITWARGLATFPAIHTPRIVVWLGAVFDGPPGFVNLAAETDEEIIVGDEARWNEQCLTPDDAAVTHFDAMQVVIFGQNPADFAFDDSD